MRLHTIPMPESSLRPTRFPIILLNCSSHYRDPTATTRPVVLKRELGNQRLQLVVFAEKFLFYGLCVGLKTETGITTLDNVALTLRIWMIGVVIETQHSP